MRVLHFINNLRMGGAQRYLVDVARCFNRSRYDLRIVTVGSGNDFEETLNVPVMNLGAELTTRNPLRLIPLFSLIRKFAPHVLHTHLRYADTIGQWVGPWMNVPTITTIHGTVEWLRNRSTLQSRIEDIGIRRCDQVIAVSEAVKQFVVEQRGVSEHRTRVLSAGVDFSGILAANREDHRMREMHELDNDTVVFACVAQFRPEKRHDLLLRDFAQLQRVSSRKIHLWLIGNGGVLRSEIARIIDRNELREHVTICEGSRRDVAQWLASADIFVMNSESEGTSLAVAEAMAAGLPQLLPRFEHFEVQVSEGTDGIFYRFDDSNDFVAAALKLVNDKALRLRLGASAQLRSLPRYGIDVHLNRLESIYDSVLQRRRDSILSAHERRN